MNATASKIVHVTAPPDAAGVRLDVFLTDAKDVELSRSQVAHLISSGKVTSGSVRLKPGLKLKGGEVFSVEIPPMQPLDIPSAENIPLDVVFEDDALIVVNKPAGMVVHPAPGHRSGTLVNALMAHCGTLSGINGALRPGIIHRLDRRTTGLLVAAKTDAAHTVLAAELQAREIVREYIAVVWGYPREKNGVIDIPIGRSRKDPKVMAVNGRSSRSAVTRYTVRDDLHELLSILDIKLETGRTHQIRVHLQHLGVPVFGDPDYGGRERRLRGVSPQQLPIARKLLKVIDRQCLHALHLTLTHPVTGEKMEFSASLPADMDDVVKHVQGRAD